MSLPNPDLSLESVWWFRYANNNGYALPVGVLPPSQTPSLTYSISVSRNATPLAPTDLVPLARNVPSAHYSGSFGLADGALAFTMSGSAVLSSEIEVESLIQAIQAANAQAVWLENHEDGEIFRVPVSTARAKRGILERKPSQPNRLEFDLTVFLSSRDWIRVSTGENFGTIF